MSGIFGIIDSAKQPIATEWLEGMMQRLSHRGKDGRKYWMEHHVGMGHLMLQISPEDRLDDSPLSYHHLTVTADSRLDGREGLCRDLGLPDGSAAEMPDSLLIAKAYEQWGENCVDYLLGDFAFAIWDQRSQALFCARDHAGIKPFFYGQCNGKFVFASEIKAIAELPFMPQDFNEELLADYLLLASWRGERAKETFFRGIYRLMPAQRLSFQQGRLNIAGYWMPAHRHTLRLPSDEDYAAALRELMEQAVSDRLRTNYPIGVQLSGGLDSSSIACIAARELAKQSRSLFAASSVLPDHHHGREKDERRFIEAVAQQEQNINTNFVSASERRIFADIHQAFDKTYSPVNAFHYMDDALDETLSKQHGVRVVLDGLLGDITLSYYHTNSLAHLLRIGRFQAAWHLFQRRKQTANTSPWNLMKQEMIKPLLPRYILDAVLQLKGLAPTPFVENTALDTNLFSAKKAEKKYKSTVMEIASQSDVYKGLWDSQMHILDEEVLVRQAHHGIEHVYPWLDKRIVDFMYSLPPEQFLHRGWPRGLIRFAMDGVIPPLVQWRQSKGAYSPDFVGRLMREAPDIQQKIVAWEKEPSRFKVVSLEKIKNMIEQLHNKEKVSIFDDGIITIAGMGLVACEYQYWLSNKKEKINSQTS